MTFDIDRVRCAIVSFTIDGVDSDTVMERLGEQAINVRVSHPDSTLLDATKRGLPPVVRAAVHDYNDDSEIDRFIAALRAIAGD